ncbi:phage integrase family protein [Micromonospora pisi]|uniref:Phage integrase family protein n=1 Tax=Micromonospora pisi TaxID=589240 RepID=A0A495JJA4_9ACTN|nr:tyrosine-type recombinase/integrase [Micromonospora pisi]RKR88402.1 phage integrase family protein [Micromonospora pisi]
MNATLTLLPQPSRPGRVGRDRLEILTALINAPSFDPIFRTDIVRIPRDHATYRWWCVIGGCERVRSSGADMCAVHMRAWSKADQHGVGKAAFLSTAEPLPASEWVEQAACRICPDRPAAHTRWRLCRRHLSQWKHHGVLDEAAFVNWVAVQQPYPGYGDCLVAVCPNLAESPLRLCSGHETRYRKAGSPGGADLSSAWSQRYEQRGRPTPVSYTDEPAFRRWCASTDPMPSPAQLNLRGLPPLLRAELQWGLFAHTQQTRPTRWDLCHVQKMVNSCRAAGTTTLAELVTDRADRWVRRIAGEITGELWRIYRTPDEARETGILDTEHFGVRFPRRTSRFDLTAIPQRWLRDLAWDHLAGLLQSPRCPRTAGSFDNLRRACVELGAFLAVDAPGGGHDPATLRGDQMRRFVADQRRRERDSLPSLGITKAGGKPSMVSATTRGIVFNGVRTVLRDALDRGAVDSLGLAREFIAAVPAWEGLPLRTRRPFPDQVARALADETNLRRLAEHHDRLDHGMRDIWETLIATGRRIGEVLDVRWDCLGRYGGLAMFWHDQTKVGNYDVAIRIPDRVYDRLQARQAKTLERFTARYGYQPAGTQRAQLALFPSPQRNPAGTVSLSKEWFYGPFRAWITELDLGHCVPHQARHTLATNLLRHGATLTHIRRYLGQVSDRMAEHYVHLAHSDLEQVLQHVWVAGPGTANPGQLLTADTIPLTRAHVQALAIDLSRRSTPAEGGFCTFQPVVDGGACPWNLDCHNCDKFVLSGADLLYWRRKREQWRLLAEGANDDATATYLQQHFEPTARAIDGLEKALAGLGLLDDALALDLRKPQDYFHRVWATVFRANDLAAAGGHADDTSDGQEAE